MVTWRIRLCLWPAIGRKVSMCEKKVQSLPSRCVRPWKYGTFPNTSHCSKDSMYYFWNPPNSLNEEVDIRKESSLLMASQLVGFFELLFVVPILNPRSKSNICWLAASFLTWRWRLYCLTVMAMMKSGPPLCSCLSNPEPSTIRVCSWCLTINAHRSAGRSMGLCLLMLPLPSHKSPASGGLRSSSCFVFLLPCLPLKCWSSASEKHSKCHLSSSPSSYFLSLCCFWYKNSCYSA